MEKYYLLTFSENWADEHDVPALACMNENEYEKWLKTKQTVDAHLGNGGDDFCDDLQGKTGKELLKLGAVSEMIVDESFYKTFKKAGLGDLSLSSVFDNEEPEDEYEEEDDF